MAPKVLVVDDEAPIANVVAMKLRNAGLDVVVAMDGQEAYEKYKAEKPNLILLEAMLPKLHGFDLTQKIYK